MFRRVSALILLAVSGLLAIPALASAATPYEAPPVTPAAHPWVPAPAAVSYTNSASLASTGAGFSVGTAVAIGFAVLLVGVALIFIGKFARKSNSH